MNQEIKLNDDEEEQNGSVKEEDADGDARMQCADSKSAKSSSSSSSSLAAMEDVVIVGQKKSSSSSSSKAKEKKENSFTNRSTGAKNFKDQLLHNKESREQAKAADKQGKRKQRVEMKKVAKMIKVLFTGLSEEHIADLEPVRCALI